MDNRGRPPDLRPLTMGGSPELPRGRAPLRVRCNAKVNLFLRVLGPRPDGYHDIETVFHSIALHDTLTLTPTAGGLTLECDAPGVPTGPDNLALKAAARVLEGTPHGVHITIEKRIPAGAGLGGGSADAAGTLVGLNSLFGLGHSQEDLARFACDLGADVRFLLEGGCAAGKGRGDDLSRLRPMAQLPIALAVPEITVSTAWAYASLKRGLTTGEVSLSMITNALETGDQARVLGLLSNDFEGLIFEKHPSVGRVKDDLLVCGAEAALMSGTGPVVYGLFLREVDASTCAGKLAGRGINAVISCLTGRSVTVSP